MDAVGLVRWVLFATDVSIVDTHDLLDRAPVDAGSGGRRAIKSATTGTNRVICPDVRLARDCIRDRYPGQVHMVRSERIRAAVP